MKISIDTDVLTRYKLTLGEFITLLSAYYNIDFANTATILVKDGIVSNNLYKDSGFILSDNTKDLITRIITESSPKLGKSPIKDFEDLAFKLISKYPNGNKPGTTYPWRGSIAEIAQKLRVLVVEHDFIFTEKEAITVTDAYVQSFKDSDNLTHMKLLKYFILRTKDGEISSDFMSSIENLREFRKLQVGDLR